MKFTWSCVCFRSIYMLTLLLLAHSALLAQSESNQPIRVGIIGTDTSHVIEFTRMFNDASQPDHVPGVRVVAAFKGGSPDVTESWERVDKYAAELQNKWRVEIVDSIPKLCSMVDGVLLESLDGRTHLNQVRPVFAAGKPVFIDKPLAASYQDAKEIARLASQAGVPWFSSSSLRYWEETQRLKNLQGAGRVLTYSVYSPSPTEPHHPDLMWYGIHGVEILFTLMGTGCESVSHMNTDAEDVVVGRWPGERLAVMRGFRKGLYAYGITAFTDKTVVNSEPKPFSYRPLLVEIAKFMHTRVPPVSADETLEIFAFMQAAELSKQQGGAEVPLSRVTH
ncbi:MAG: Gfo/Idh/MocA family oxidoreductase [Terriglobia bacterium]